MLTSDLYLSGKKSEHEKKATNLAASGMQAIYAPINYKNNLSNDANRINYLKTAYYDVWQSITLPEGGKIYYRQYLIAKNTTEANILTATPIPLNSIAGVNYKVVVTAIAGDLNNNQVKDSNEPFYYLKNLYRDLGN
ncbi:MAG TPA: hypothetical protein VGE40_04875 [Bacilli bacterium]